MNGWRRSVGPRRAGIVARALTIAVALAISAAACDRNVPIGVDPRSDAAPADGGDAGASD